MTPTPADPQPRRDGPSAVRTCAAGGLAAVALVGIAAGVGLPAGTLPHVLLGTGVACLAGSLGCLVHLRAARQPGGTPQSAWQLRSALVLDFLLKLVGLAAGIGILGLAGVKFTGLAGFGLAFAGASMAFQLVSSVTLARGWARRNRVSKTDRASDPHRGDPSAEASSAGEPGGRVPTTD